MSDINRQLALSTAFAICKKNRMTEAEVDYLIEAAMKRISPEVREIDRVVAACEIVGLCMLKEVMNE